ncbi:MAG TPA: cytochrome c3 family protein, partial [Anaerolineae bacterium]|nr:cytochrome c3 family protein [Anaerolineae bacterium]
MHRLIPIVALSVILLSWLVLVRPASSLQIPIVPHATEGLEDCLACHDAGQMAPFPEDHAGRENESCTMCHEVQPDGVPPVPHELEGREDCLACHGPDGVIPFPESHEGLENDTCLFCHPIGVGSPDTGQPEATPEATAEPTATLPPAIEALPTPIQEPELFGENTCITCHLELGGRHAQITQNWSQSIHAERGVGCVSCHGGDPTAEDPDESMSPAHGFLGPLPKERIPGLCASCHSRVDLMRQFDLPTDQFDQYWQSHHGQALLEGDENVATCFDCHDGHNTLPTNDPASLVYPLNEPIMCAGCHSNEALMAPYDIPTNQYDLYVDSVHGVALLDEQDMRAPVCSTCHGTHGAAPPGFQEVANVCGQCHGATEDYYLQGGHRMGMTVEALPRCVTCHGRYDVPPATIDLFVGTEDRHCGSCHPPGSERADEVQAMYEALLSARETYEEAALTIEEASGRRLIMAEQEELLLQGLTP